MAITNFIATIWSARVLENLRKELVFGDIVNRDYEGEIAGQGSTVKIGSIGAVTIGNYDKNTGIGDPEQLNDSANQLVIDQAKFFAFRVDDVEAAQTKVDLIDAAMAEAAYGLADAADQYIAGLYTGVDAVNTIGDDTTPIVPTASNAYDYLVDLAVKLDEANVPRANRFVVVPPWYHGLLVKDARFTKNDTVLANGRVGQAAGFDVRVSNNVPNTAGTKYKIMAGYKGAITFADAIDEVEAYRPEKFFADAVRGLHLYGAKLVRPKGIAVLTANKS